MTDMSSGLMCDVMSVWREFGIYSTYVVVNILWYMPTYVAASHTIVRQGAG